MDHNYTFGAFTCSNCGGEVGAGKGFVFGKCPHCKHPLTGMKFKCEDCGHEGPPVCYNSKPSSDALKVTIGIILLVTTCIGGILWFIVVFGMGNKGAPEYRGCQKCKSPRIYPTGYKGVKDIPPLHALSESPAGTASDDIPEDEKDLTSPCPMCGKTISSWAKACQFCGERLS